MPTIQQMSGRWPELGFGARFAPFVRQENRGTPARANGGTAETYGGDIAMEASKSERKGRRPEKKNSLKIRKGASAEFPVGKDHPHAQFQQLVPIKSGKDIEPFMPLWRGRAAAAGGELPEAESVHGILKIAADDIPNVLRLQASDLVIPAGSTVVLTNPLNHLQFENVEIQGDLVCKGDLVLECTNLK
jgi:hypothetical protein